MTVLVIGEALVDVVSRDGGEPSPTLAGRRSTSRSGWPASTSRRGLAAQIGAGRLTGICCASTSHHADVQLDLLEPAPGSARRRAQARLAADGSARLHVRPGLGSRPRCPTPPASRPCTSVRSGRLSSPGRRWVAGMAVGRRRLWVSRCSYDPNVRLAVEPDVTVWQRSVRRDRAHASIVKLSAEDAAALLPGEDLRELGVPVGRRPGDRRGHPGRRRRDRRASADLVVGAAGGRPRRRHDRGRRRVHGRDAVVVRDVRLADRPASSTRPS